MSQDPFKKEQHLRKKLEEYHVDIPDFPMKRTLWGRFIHLLASPAKDPFDPFISTSKGVLALKILPVMGAFALTLLPFL